MPTLSPTATPSEARPPAISRIARPNSAYVIVGRPGARIASPEWRSAAARASSPSERTAEVGRWAVSAITDKPYFPAAQKRQRVAPWGSAVATPNTVWNVTRNSCHGPGPVLGAL